MSEVEPGLVSPGLVSLVGAGPGDPELLTIKALRALQRADVVLHDFLVSAEVLVLARREARRIVVGKRGHGPSCPQSEINRLIVTLARKGHRVVRLKGGDPLFFGRAAEEIAACREAGIAVEIIPGITAAQGAAASLGVPLTDRDGSPRMQFISGHGRNGDLPEDFDARILADRSVLTAIYMGRRTFARLRDMALAAGIDPQTPAMAVFSATRPEQHSIGGTIADLPERISSLPSAEPVILLLGWALRHAVHAGACPGEVRPREACPGEAGENLPANRRRVA